MLSGFGIGPAVMMIDDGGRNPTSKGQGSNATFGSAAPGPSTFHFTQKIQKPPQPVQPRDRRGRFASKRNARSRLRPHRLKVTLEPMPDPDLEALDRAYAMILNHRRDSKSDGEPAECQGSKQQRLF